MPTNANMHRWSHRSLSLSLSFSFIHFLSFLLFFRFLFPLPFLFGLVFFQSIGHQRKPQHHFNKGIFFFLPFFQTAKSNSKTNFFFRVQKKTGVLECDAVSFLGFGVSLLFSFFVLALFKSRRFLKKVADLIGQPPNSIPVPKKNKRKTLQI